MTGKNSKLWVNDPQRHVRVLDQDKTPSVAATLVRRLANLAVFILPILLGLALLFGWFNGKGERDRLDTGTATGSKIEQPTKKPGDTEPATKIAPPSKVSLTNVAPPTPWISIDAEKPLTRIGVGSCLHQSQPQPIWTDVLTLKKRPDLFLMIGDNIYGDIKSANYERMIRAYRTQGRHPDFSKARKAMPFLATWDDHDYGANDAGSEFPHKQAAAKLFSQFWDIDPGRPARAGIYYSKMIGPVGKRVHIIMLDTRTFRSNLMRKTRPLAYWGKYQPDPDHTKTILGQEQWDWLNHELSRRADFRVIVSSIQVLASGHGFERWGNLPRELIRFVTAIEFAPKVPTIIVSGDRHMAAMYEWPLAEQRTLLEITTSSLNRSYGPSQDVHGPELISDIYHKENFALIDIDWSRGEVALSLRGLGGEKFHDATYSFSQLAD